MPRLFPRSPAGLVLAATLLPLCSFAAPLRLHFTGCDSSVKGVPALSAKGCKASTTSALTKAVKLEKGKASLVRGATQEADVRVTGTVEPGDSPKKFRVVYLLQTQQEPRLEKEVTYALTSPRFNAKTLTVTARELITEAVKLEEARQAEASRPEPVATPEPAPQPEPVVAAAPEPAPQPEPVVAAAPVAEAPRQPLESSAPIETTFKVRKQPLIVVHTGLAGLWGYGMETFGVGAVLEPKWNITDSIAAGMRFDGGVTFGGRIAPEGTSSFALGASAATLLKGEYLFFDSGVRPFVGLGAGMYILANQSVSAGNSGAGVAQSGGRFFGVAPQLGIDFGGVRLGATYNHILGGDIVIEQNVGVGGVQAERIQRNYVQLELSFRMFKFGGSERPAVSRGY